MGTPEFAVPALRAVAKRCEVPLVVTQPDRPSGRGQKSASSAVAREAEALALTTLKPEDVNAAEWMDRLRGAAPDLIAVVAFGSILGSPLLRLPRLGAINLHGSLLPDYRGASPVQRALWDGRAATGVTTIWMDEGIDTGDLIHQQWAPILPTDDAASLAARLAELGGPLLADSLGAAAEGRAPRQPQDHATGSYARRMLKRDGVVDWSLPAESVWNHQRAVTPWPGATARLEARGVLLTATEPLHALMTADPAGQVIAVNSFGLDVACGRGALRLRRVRPEGKPEMAAADWARGARIEPGTRFEAPEGVT